MLATKRVAEAPATMLEILGHVDERATPTPIPLAAGEVRAGFPSPAVFPSSPCCQFAELSELV